MDVGIGLPSTLPWVRGEDVVEWARRGEAAGFSSLGTIDRVCYGNHETVATLAAAAAVTERVGLVSSVLVAPYRGNGALLAKQLATVDSLSGGRLTVGLGVGGGEDDYRANGVDFRRRGRIFDAQLAEMAAVWSGEPRGMAGAIGPPPAHPAGPPMMLGGTSEAAVRRTVRYGVGWIGGVAGPEVFASTAARVRPAWQAAGREGAPRLGAIAYFALGPRADDHARRTVMDYYGWMGDPAQGILGKVLTSEERLRGAVATYTELGCDELVLFPCSVELDQVERLADVALA
ncbi:MAG TPA: LLM class flavin-dependent oxidoreductase [Acidimicrobiales bacterium]|nr:LLM class flavin-dependent oxidoreductase [Acidimicrobiales bacterium]